MQFKQGVSVYTIDEKEAGHIDRVVIEPKSKRVTHIVIRKGVLLTEDKVVPLNLIATGNAERINLRLKSKEVDQLPDFIETHYVVLNEDELGPEFKREANFAPAIYWYPAYPEAPLMPYREPPYLPEVKMNIPSGTVAVREGAKVVTRDEKHIGNVEQVFSDARTNRVTHFVIAKGIVLREKKMVPVGWIDTLNENEVRLAVRARLVEELPSLEHA